MDGNTATPKTYYRLRDKSDRLLEGLGYSSAAISDSLAICNAVVLGGDSPSAAEDDGVTVHYPHPPPGTTALPG